MAENDVVLASAVVVPEPEPFPAPASPPMNASRKRRQSSIASADSKRPRISGKREASATPPGSAPPARGANGSGGRSARQPSGQEERQRGKRLFGALLGNLSQGRTATATAAQRRRAEIEQKQQAKLRQQGDEDEAARRGRLERLGRRRRREDWAWERESLDARHAAMRARAGMLRTLAEPAIYYMPYELGEREKAQIKRQKEEVEDDIERELDDFEERRRIGLEELDREEAALAQQNPGGEGSIHLNGHGEEAAAGKDSDVDMDAEGPPSVPPTATNGDSKDADTKANGHATDIDERTGDHANGDTAESERRTAPEPLAAEQPPDASSETLPDAHRDAHDDAGEVVEGDEDAVMY